jgi:ubiquinol-cytochrome c reductase cytochrome c subunit
MRYLLLIALLLAGGVAPNAMAARNGGSLYAETCSRCHGSVGRGLPGKGPSLRGVGALAADFYLRTGYMPLRAPTDQPSRSHVLFSEPELQALIRYVAGLGHGPAVPKPQPGTAKLSTGFELFTQHCAGCHQAVAQGGYVTGARVPPLTDATATQIAEAIRIGPYLMPRFSAKALSAADVNAIVAYVQYTQHPDDRGGLSIGHLGPWPEGMIAWLLAGSLLVATCVVIGGRFRP